MSAPDTLESNLRAWAAIYGRKLTNEALDQWMRIFASTEVSILNEAMQDVTENAERMPTPGMLTKAIALVRERRHMPQVSRAAKDCLHCKGTGFRIIEVTDALGRHKKAAKCHCWGEPKPAETKYRKAVAKDQETGKDVDVLIEEGTEEVLYKAQDCPEGRAFLQKLRSYGKSHRAIRQRGIPSGDSAA